MKTNSGVRCDVTSCKHNEDGCDCRLKEISVECSCGEKCSCCGSYEEK